ITAIETLRGDRHALSAPRRVGLGDGDREHRLATGNAWQKRALLSVGRGLQHGESAEHARAEERSGQRTAAQLLVEDGRVGETALAAAVAFGDEHAEPAQLTGLP